MFTFPFLTSYSCPLFMYQRGCFPLWMIYWTLNNWRFLIPVLLTTTEHISSEDDRLRQQIVVATHTTGQEAADKSRRLYNCCCCLVVMDVSDIQTFRGGNIILSTASSSVVRPYTELQLHSSIKWPLKWVVLPWQTRKRWDVGWRRGRGDLQLS